MNREEVLQILQLKHVILCGGSESGRKMLIEAVSEGFDKDKVDVFSIPSGIRSRIAFIDTVRHIFPIKPLLKGQTVEEMAPVQIDDVLLDWTEWHGKSILIIWEELGSLEPKDWLYNYINDFVTSKYIVEEYFEREIKLRLLASSSVHLSDYFNSAKIYFGRGEDDPLTDDQVARNSLEIINLDESL